MRHGKILPPSRKNGGLFDLQVNGFAGVDFQQDDLSASGLSRAAHALRARNTGRILLTLITDTIDSLCRKLTRIEGFRRRNPLIATTVVGYHIEGPYLLAKNGFSGAHDPRLMHPPSIAEFERLWDASRGNIRLVTIAPELEGSAAFIRHVVSRGVRVAIGHSDADDRAIDDAISAGLSLCTHLGNGVPLRLHRHDNIVHRLLARDSLYAAFIPDGIHLPPSVLKNMVRAKPRNRVLFTTDCMAAAGAPAGQYSLGRIMTEVAEDRVVRQPGNPRYFAGSSLTLDAGVQNVQDFLGWSPADSVAACSSRVAKYLGLEAAD
jgi:N-acetylglucosamine-6-phosphate deacetylase